MWAVKNSQKRRSARSLGEKSAGVAVRGVGGGEPAEASMGVSGVLGRGESRVTAVPVQSHSSARLNVTASNGAMRTGSSSSTVAMSCHFPS